MSNSLSGFKESSSSSGSYGPCAFCSKSLSSKYSCPKCNQSFCSVECYRCESHGGCSQGFYRDSIKDFLLNDPTAAGSVDPETKKKTLEMIRRSAEMDLMDESEFGAVGGCLPHGVKTRNNGQKIESDKDSDDDDDEDDTSDESDDEDDPQDFDKRFEGINLDTEDLDEDTVSEIMKRLTDDEKREFECLIESGDILNMIPLNEMVKLKPPPLVEEINTDNDDDDLEFEFDVKDTINGRFHCNSTGSGSSSSCRTSSNASGSNGHHHPNHHDGPSTSVTPPDQMLPSETASVITKKKSKLVNLSNGHGTT